MTGQLGVSRILPDKEGSIKEIVGLLTIMALFIGCHDTTDVSAGWLTATIQPGADGAEAPTAYQGTGDYNVGKDPGVGASVAFGLTSKGTGTSVGQSFGLHWPGSGRPGPGRYQLAPLRTEDGHSDGFTAHYHRTSAGRSESFTALSGEVEITESSVERIEGVFQFTGVLYCSVAVVGPAPDDWCQGPNTITPGARQVDIAGSFSATPIKLGPETPSVP